MTASEPAPSRLRDALAVLGISLTEERESALAQDQEVLLQRAASVRAGLTPQDEPGPLDLRPT